MIDLQLALQRELTHNERLNVVLESAAHADEDEEIEWIDPVPDWEPTEGKQLWQQHHTTPSACL